MHVLLPFIFAQHLPFLVVIYSICVAIVHLGFAAAVARDVGRLKQEQAGPLIAGPFLWFLATLVGGVFVAGLYWLIHYSALSRREGL